MRSVTSRLHRAAVASAVAAGVALLGVSVSGIAAIRSDLATVRDAPPSRLVDEPSWRYEHDGPCHRRDPAPSPGV